MGTGHRRKGQERCACWRGGGVLGALCEHDLGGSQGGKGGGCCPRSPQKGSRPPAPGWPRMATPACRVLGTGRPDVCVCGLPDTAPARLLTQPRDRLNKQACLFRGKTTRSYTTHQPGTLLPLPTGLGRGSGGCLPPSGQVHLCTSGPWARAGSRRLGAAHTHAAAQGLPVPVLKISDLVFDRCLTWTPGNKADPKYGGHKEEEEEGGRCGPPLSLGSATHPPACSNSGVCKPGLGAT